MGCIWRHTQKRPRSIANCEEGLAALEFALIAPTFLLLVMGIIEFSLIMFANSVMENATDLSARIGKTGYVAAGTTRQQEIIDSINKHAGLLLDTSKVTITTEVYSTFNKVGQPEPCLSPTTPPCPGTPGVNFTDINGNGTWDSDMGKAGLGNAGDVVLYTITYPWPVATPLLKPFLGTNYTITTRTLVRNEPF